MATLKQRLHRKNGSAYDIIHMETESNVVLRPSGNTVETDLTNYLPKVQNSDDVPEGLTSGQIVTGNTKVFVCTGDGTIRTFKEEGGGSVPVLGVDFTYSGECQVIDDSDDEGIKWRVKFLTSGIFKPSVNMKIDIFYVGAGGGGGSTKLNSDTAYGGSGGGGGYTKTVKSLILNANTEYQITIGTGGTTNTNGGSTSAFGESSNGGNGGNNGGKNTTGGAGGSGGGCSGTTTGVNTSPGAGGSDGSNGENMGTKLGGTGQGTTTREFEESTGDLYSGGGGGGYAYYRSGIGEQSGGSGGAGGGGNGGGNRSGPSSGTKNTGGGGGGGSVAGSSYNFTGASGGSGIVIIRNTRS